MAEKEYRLWVREPRKLWEKPAGQVRFVVPNHTTTDPPQLQQLWEIRWTDRYESEWRPVPTVVGEKAS